MTEQQCMKKLQAVAKKCGYELSVELQGNHGYAAIHPDVMKLVLLTIKPALKLRKHEKDKDTAVPVNHLNGSHK